MVTFFSSDYDEGCHIVLEVSEELNDLLVARGWCMRGIDS